MPPTKIIDNVQLSVGTNYSEGYTLPGNYKSKNLLVRVVVSNADAQDTDLRLEIGFQWLDGATWRHKVSAKYDGGTHNQEGDEWGVVLHGSEKMKGRTIRGYVVTNKAITVDVEVESY